MSETSKIDTLADRIVDLVKNTDDVGVAGCEVARILRDELPELWEWEAMSAENKRLRAKIADLEAQLAASHQDYKTQTVAIVDRDDEIEWLRAIVERLPKTRDGVVKCAHMGTYDDLDRVFAFVEGKIREGTVIDNDPHTDEQVEFMVTDTHYEYLSVNHCYSFMENVKSRESQRG